MVSWWWFIAGFAAVAVGKLVELAGIWLAPVPPPEEALEPATPAAERKASAAGAGEPPAAEAAGWMAPPEEMGDF